MITRFFHTVLPMLLVGVLAACDPITLGLGLGGGYVASREIGKSKEKQERAVERRLDREQDYYKEQERGQQSAQDQQIAAQTGLALLGGGLTNVMTVTLDVRGGVVTLYGTVPSPSVADRAVDTARKIPGVREVVSRLNILEMSINPTGKAWQHVANVRVQQAPPQQQPMPQLPVVRVPQEGQPQNYQNAVPPRAIEPGQQEPPRQQRVRQFPSGFTPAMIERDGAPAQQGSPPPQQQPVPYPTQMPPQPQPQYGEQPTQQQYYQPPAYQEPAGTVPRTLPQVEQQNSGASYGDD